MQVDLFFHIKDKIPVFMYSGTVYKFKCSDVHLPVMARQSAILKLQCGSTSKFLLLLERELKGIKILPLRNNLFCSDSSDL